MTIGSWTHDQFMEEVRKFHGYPAPGVIVGGYMVETARRALPEGILYDAISETVQCLPDAVQLLTPCTVGNGWLRIRNFGIYALSLFDKHTGEGVRVHLDVDKLGPWPEIRAWFLKEKAKAEQDSERLQQEIRDAGTDILSMRSIRVQAAVLGHKSKGRVIRCPLCGDWYPSAFGGICRSCQGASPYEVGPGLAFTTARAVPEPVPVEQAVGQHALHDMTRIIPGEEKSAAFHAGQEISAGDVCRLQRMGRYRVYTQETAEVNPNWLHEDVVAKVFAELMPGDGVAPDGVPREGKVNFAATRDGLLSVDVDRLERFNLVPDVMCATRHTMTMIRKGARLAGSRAIPLFLSRTDFLKATSLLDDGPLFSVLPMRRAKVGILVTGTEIFQGVIQDKFVPIIMRKARQLQCGIAGTRIAPDEAGRITDAVRELLAIGADLIITTAGLSVDPDDVTRKALLNAGLKDMLYGLPVLPGAMTLVGRIDGAQVLGVPACALFFKTTALDLMLPRLLAEAPLTRRDLARLGHGGLCMECKSCVFPKCPFGR